MARVAAEQLESHNLQLKLQVQTLEEQKSKLQLELKNLINVDAKHKAEIAGRSIHSHRFLPSFTVVVLLTFYLVLDRQFCFAVTKISKN